MKITKNYYVISTVTFPLKFDADDRLDDYCEGEFTDYIEDAYKYDTEESAQKEIDNSFDIPELYQVSPLTINYEI